MTSIYLTSCLLACPPDLESEQVWAEAVKVRPFLFLWVLVLIEEFLKEKQSVFTFILPYI